MTENKKNIVLIGFMAAGKSSVANYLKNQLNLPVYSTDSLIQEKEGRDIGDIFDKQGESYFRQLECDVVSDIFDMTGVIVDCGGGMVNNKECINKLKCNGIIFYLSVDPNVVLRRIEKSNTQRPLLNVENPYETIENLLNERKTLYYDAADYIIDSNNDDVSIASEEIIRLFLS